MTRLRTLLLELPALAAVAAALVLTGDLAIAAACGLAAAGAQIVIAKRRGTVPGSLTWAGLSLALALGGATVFGDASAAPHLLSPASCTDLHCTCPLPPTAI